MKKLIALAGGCLAATVRAAAFLACLPPASVRAQGWVQPMTSASVARRGADAFDPLDDLLHLERLPLSRGGAYVRYEGSIDKRGLNDDQNWYAHPCGTNEWIVFEGEGAFRSPLTLRGRYGAAAELRFTVPERTVRVVVRRVSDQRLPRQLARVSVNGRELADLPWFVQDCNPYHRWLEDDYPVAARNLRLGEVNVIRIEPQPCDGVTAFNDFGYRVFAVVDTVSLPR